MLLVGSLLFCFSLAEVAIRVIGEFDDSGNFMFKNRIIHPHKLPVKSVSRLAAALQASDRSLVVYDEVLGWTPRPGGSSENGLYQYNTQGIRSPIAAYSAQPDSGVFRIALFGDSFTHGNDVPYEDSFGAILEEMLNQAGVRTEVLNFGVGGYGIDQAMLRYGRHGVGFSPHLVVFGFQPENLKRNLNILRPLYDPRTRLPLAKPRFVQDGQGMKLINMPVLPPEEMFSVLQNINDWPLLQYEHFYEPADFQSSWWQKSKLLATIVDLKANRENTWLLKRILYTERSEEQRLGWSIIQTFAQEVDQSGADFMIVHLPTAQEMNLRRGLKRWPYQTFLDALDGQNEVVHPEERLFEAVNEIGYEGIFQGHFTRAGNRIIAESVFEQIHQD